MINRLSRPCRFAATLALMLVFAPALAQPATQAPITFGTRTLQVPAPQGDESVSQKLPMFFSVMEKYVPASNRMVEVYMSHEQLIALVLGTSKAPDRFFDLQVMRVLDGERVSQSQFAAGKPQIVKGLTDSKTLVQHGVDQSLHDANQKMQKLTGKDPGVSVTATSNPGEFRDEPWGVFFTSTLSASATHQATVPMVYSMAIVCIDGQVMYLYAYAHDDGRDGRGWTQHGVSQWADAIRAANPI